MYVYSTVQVGASMAQALALDATERGGEDALDALGDPSVRGSHRQSRRRSWRAIGGLGVVGYDLEAQQAVVAAGGGGGRAALAVERGGGAHVRGRGVDTLEHREARLRRDDAVNLQREKAGGGSAGRRATGIRGGRRTASGLVDARRGV